MLEGFQIHLSESLYRGVRRPDPGERTLCGILTYSFTISLTFCQWCRVGFLGISRGFGVFRRLVGYLFTFLSLFIRIDRPAAVCRRRPGCPRLCSGHYYRQAAAGAGHPAVFVAKHLTLRREDVILLTDSALPGRIAPVCAPFFRSNDL